MDRQYTDMDQVKFRKTVKDYWKSYTMKEEWKMIANVQCGQLKNAGWLKTK